MENNILVLKTYVDGGVGDTPFPQDADSPIEIGAFRYDAKRMGGAPIITASVNYPSCLDSKWTNKVYAKFRGERYFLKQTPTSAYDNQDTMYKHDIELVSERIILDNVYFFDTAVGNPAESDKAVSNSTKVVFYGSVHEFAKRLNASLEYTKLLKWEDGVNEDGEPIKIANGYNVVVDEGVGSEEKLMSFEDQFFSNVLQEIYNTYDVPYYFVGKTIHIGFSDDVYPHTFSYGVDDALISITKNNANYKVVNRVTGKGSTDNIPYYYPNNSPKGEIKAECNNSELEVVIKDYDKYANEVNIGEIIERTDLDYSISSITPKTNNSSSFSENENILVDTVSSEHQFKVDIEIEGQASQKGEANFEINISDFVMYYEWGEAIDVPIDVMFFGEAQKWSTYNNHYYWSGYGYDCYIDQKKWRFNKTQNSCTIHVRYTVDGSSEQKLKLSLRTGSHSDERGRRMSFVMKIKSLDNDGWKLGEKKISLEDVGLASNGLAQVGDTITQRLVKSVNTSQNLMPSVYRHSAGKERFYNAINYPYPKYEGFDETLEEGYYGEDGIQRNALGEYEIDGMIHNDAYKGADGKYIRFKNPYFEGTPKEHAISVEDLKPTIKEAVNSMGLRMDMFSEFAYDLDDNDETEENEDGTDRDFIHSYFFGKLRKLDFNLFEHAIEQQPMTISFTSGNCGACNFEIGVTKEFPQKNPVLVNADGSLKRDEKGRVICGQFQEITEDEIQDEQQDTSKNEVWIALKKEESTYGILMPKATIKEEDAEGNIIEVGGHQPKACTVNEDGTVNNDGDTFVILGINLPDSYISNAEDKLRDEIIKYIKENNVEKFNFSITFSRIYFAENPNVLQFLNENSRINIEYNGKIYTLYVTSYSYNMGEGDVLPEIRVELDDKLTLSQNALQNAINEVKSEVGMAFANFDVLAFASPYFLRKDVDDICNATIDFKKGIKFGEGGKVEVLDNNSAKLTIEYLEVTKKASFTSLEIKEKTHVGGQIIISPAAMTCGEVEELEDSYRCYFQTKNAEGDDEIFNQFAENDLAICQTYNAWGSRYYWRKVVGVGEDYIDLSKTLCDEYSDVPMIGDKIIQLGNTVDITRQSAIVLSAYGDNAPSFIMYNGINDFTLVDKNITGIIWNPKTLEPQMYSYGSFFFGDGTTDENGNLVGEDFITFQKRGGDTKKKLHINATVNFSSDSTGLSNLEEWKGVQSEISGINKTIERVQDQIDGVVENWSGDYSPTTANEPAWSWLIQGNEAMIAHINDTFVNIEPYVDDETTPESGKAWRWCKCTNESITDFVTVTDKDGEEFNLHWHPIADSDAVRALREVATKADKSDLEVLTKNLKDGSTIVDGGLVMTSLVAVRNNEEKIEAFLNGSGEFNDDTHGKLILAGGIPEGTTNIKERAKEALTRIYEDGTIETKRANIEGTIVAKSGKIGDFNITSGIEAEYDTFDEIGYGEQGEVSVRPQSVKLYHYSKDYYAPEFKGQCDMYPAIGGGVAGSYAFGSIIRSEILDNTYDDSNYPTECVGIIVSAKGAKGITANGLYGGNFAIKAEDGMFAGLRPRYRRVTSSTELSKYDHTIECLRTDGGNVWISLPTDPEKGQCYEIWKWGTCNVYINGKTKKIVRVGVVEQLEHGIDNTFTGIIKLVYRGNETDVNNWLMTLHRTE